MAREKIFEETFTFDTVEGSTSEGEFFLMERPTFDSTPVQGDTATLNVKVNCESEANYYVKVYVDGQMQVDEADLPLFPADSGWDIGPFDLNIPEKSEFTVTIEGGTE